MTVEPLEMPEGLRDMGYDRVAQRGARVIYHYPETRSISKPLRKWMTEGLEFADADIARTADFRRNTFGLHWFTSWEDAEAWLRGDGTHERWHDCLDCAEARAVHERVWARLR